MIALERLRWIGCSHVDADEYGALHHLQAEAPQGDKVAVTVSMIDLADQCPAD